MDKELPVATHHIRLSLIPVSLRIVGGIFFLDTVYGLLLLVTTVMNIDPSYENEVLIGFFILHGIKFLFVLFLVLDTVFEWATTTYYVHDEHLIRRSGVVKFEEDVYNLHGIRFVNVEENWLSKMLNYGTVLLTFGTSGYREQVRLKGIVNPKKYEQLFRTYLGVEAKDYPTDEVPFKVKP